MARTPPTPPLGLARKSPTEGEPGDDKHDYQLLFHDSSDAYWIRNARQVFCPYGWVMFLVFKGDKWAYNEYYHADAIYRIRRYPIPPK